MHPRPVPLRIPVRRAGLAALSALALAAACASSGHKFSADNLPRVVEGQSTQKDVREIFGEPTTIRIDSRGHSTYRYFYAERHSADTGFFTRIGVFIARVFGRWWPNPPFGVRHTTEIRHDLLVAFDAEGVVERYTYERTERPTTEVY